MSGFGYNAAPAGGDSTVQGGGRRKVTAKALRRALKKAGLKTTGKKAALTRRVKKAHLKVGGSNGDGVVPPAAPPSPPKEDPVGGRSRRSRKGKGFRLF